MWMNKIDYDADIASDCDADLDMATDCEVWGYSEKEEEVENGKMVL
jgi:hypothetical protein